jgi:two-component system phosphate regulon sensor histidine kinase PhoR
MVLSMENLSISGFLKEVSDHWGHDMDPENKTHEMSFAPGRDIVRADPLRLSQVMTNLFDNILRHARGFTLIKMGTTTEDRKICIYVEDNGIGIPESDLPHIFQRFFRVDKGRSRESGGTGLGLAIVKHIVVQHQGTIKAISGKGEGTRIEIRLPLAPEPGPKKPGSTDSSG